MKLIFKIFLIFTLLKLITANELIERTYPRNGETNVSISIRSIYIYFKEDMCTNTSLRLNNMDITGEWQSNKILRIKFTPIYSKKYSITLNPRDSKMGFSTLKSMTTLPEYKFSFSIEDEKGWHRINNFISCNDSLIQRAFINIEAKRIKSTLATLKRTINIDTEIPHIYIYIDALKKNLKKYFFYSTDCNNIYIKISDIGFGTLNPEYLIGIIKKGITEYLLRKRFKKKIILYNNKFLKALIIFIATNPSNNPDINIYISSIVNSNIKPDKEIYYSILSSLIVQDNIVDITNFIDMMYTTYSIESLFTVFFKKPIEVLIKNINEQAKLKYSFLKIKQYSASIIDKSIPDTDIYKIDKNSNRILKKLKKYNALNLKIIILSKPSFKKIFKTDCSSILIENFLYINFKNTEQTMNIIIKKNLKYTFTTLPFWFISGIASLIQDINNIYKNKKPVQLKKLLLLNLDYTGYKYERELDILGNNFFNFIIHIYGKDKVLFFIKHKNLSDFNKAFKSFFGRSLDELYNKYSSKYSE